MGTPQQVGRYTIQSELGRGGLAVVFLATDARVGGEVALKVLPREFAEGPSFRARFERDAKAISELKHPAIVPLLDYGEDRLLHFYAMPRLAGALPTRLARGPMKPPEITRVLERVTAALDFAHSKRIVHRNLRAGNILFDSKGQAYVSDFGIVTLPEVATEVPQHVLMRTLAYMSPEQIRREEVGPPTDIYALGVILFQMLSGALPYQAANPQALAGQHLSKPVPSVTEAMGGLRPGVQAGGASGAALPVGMDEVISRALAKRPEERFASAGALWAAWTAETGASPKRADAPMPVTASGPTPAASAEQTRNVLTALLIGALGLVLLVLLAIVAITLLNPWGARGASQALTQTHRADSLGYSMDLPSGWLATDASAFGQLGGGTTVTVAGADQGSYDTLLSAVDSGNIGMSGPVFFAIALPLEDVPQIVILPRALIVIFKENGPPSGFTYRRTHRTTVDSTRAAWTDFSGTDEGTGQTIAGRVVAVSWAQQAGFLVGVAPEDQWDDFAPTFEAMIESVELFAPSGSPPDLLGGPLTEFAPTGGDVGEFGDGLLTGAEWSIQVNGGASQWELPEGYCTAGQQVTITMRAQSEVLDPYVTLYTSSGAYVDYDDDSGGDYDAQLTATLPETGRYVVRATSYFGEGGSYTISVSNP
jgi:hypothetical protein